MGSVPGNHGIFYLLQYFSTLGKFSCPGVWASEEKIWPVGNLSLIIRCDIS